MLFNAYKCVIGFILWVFIVIEVFLRIISRFYTILKLGEQFSCPTPFEGPKVEWVRIYLDLGLLHRVITIPCEM